MHDNTEEVTEQDIAKELEERGYSEEEINEILQEGKEAQEKTDEENEYNDKVRTIVMIVCCTILVILIGVGIFIAIKS